MGFEQAYIIDFWLIKLVHHLQLLIGFQIQLIHPVNIKYFDSKQLEAHNAHKLA